MDLFQGKRKRSVLIIDSDQTSAERLQSLLQEKHFTAYTAETLHEALKILKDNRGVAVVLLPVGRPSLDHEKIIKSLKQTSNGKRIPVIVIVEEFLEDLVASTLKGGADDFITWPADLEELVRRVRVHARVTENDVDIPEPEASHKKHEEAGEVGLFFTSKNGELLECNDALVKMLGYDSKDDLLYTNVEETLYLDPEERNKFRNAVEKKGKVKDFRVTFKQRDGHPMTILISGQVVTNDQGQIVGYRGENIPLSESGPIGRSILSELFPRLSGGYHSLFRATKLLGYRYEKVTRLGIGSFGEVWKVRDVLKDRPSIFVAKIPMDKKLNAKFEKEARILKKLTGHPGIPEIREVLKAEKKSVLIQEFVEGKTLFEMIERELAEKEAESVIIQLTDIVAHAHQLGIIHRDIKPGNVMVKPDGKIKLLDFGAAKELDEKEISGTVIGSRPYMSPEQIMGKSQKRSDVWALGVVMYVLYTGMFPFYHDVEKVLMDMILELPPTPPSRYKENIQPEIEQIILKCLEKNPENRCNDARSLMNTLAETIPGYGDGILPLY